MSEERKRVKCDDADSMSANCVKKIETREHMLCVRDLREDLRKWFPKIKFGVRVFTDGCIHRIDVVVKSADACLVPSIQLVVCKYSMLRTSVTDDVFMYTRNVIAPHQVHVVRVLVK